MLKRKRNTRIGLYHILVESANKNSLSRLLMLSTAFVHSTRLLTIGWLFHQLMQEGCTSKRLVAAPRLMHTRSGSITMY